MKLLAFGTVLLACSQSCLGVVLEMRNGVDCSIVDGTTKSPGIISISLSGEVVSDSPVEVPYLILRYSEILNLANIPPFEKYRKEYNDSRQNLYSSVLAMSKFDLSTHKGLKADMSTVFTSSLNWDEVTQSTYKVDKSGLYCIYIAPPVDESIRLHLKVEIFNSHGKLSLMNNASYKKHKASLVSGIILCLFLRHALISWRSRSQVSIVSKSVLLFVIFPFTLLSLVQVIAGYLVNINAVEQKMLFHLNLLDLYLKTWFSCCTLLFGMGYGVIYNSRSSSRRNESFKKNQLKVALSILSVFSVVGSILHWIQSEKLNNLVRFEGSVGPKSQSGLTHTVEQGLIILLVVIKVSSFVLTFYHYEWTKDTIKELPVTNKNGSSVSSFSIERLLSSCKKSMLSLYLWSKVASMACSMLGALALLAAKKSATRAFQTQLLANAGRDQLVTSALKQITFEGTLLTNLFFEWLRSMLNLFPYVCLFFIWLDYDNGFTFDNAAIEMDLRTNEI